MWGIEHNVFYNYIDNQGLKNYCISKEHQHWASAYI